MKFELHISGPYGSQNVTVEDEVSIGRSEQASVAVDDQGLSRVNTTFFVDEGKLLVVDENSTNGTFVNGEKISGPPRQLRSGDVLKIGTYTEVKVGGEGDAKAAVAAPETTVTYSKGGEPLPAKKVDQTTVPPPSSKPKIAGSSTAKNQKNLIAVSAGLTLLILILGGVGIFFLVRGRGGNSGPGKRPVIIASAIPLRVIDPLGGEDEDDLNDLIASWETSEKEIDASSVSDVSVDPSDTEDAELNVTAAQLADAQRKALEARQGPTGIRPAGLDVPKELYGDGVIKQKAKLREMKNSGYHQPLDFGDLAEKRLSREFIEMPMATNTFYLDVGGSAQDTPFMSFDWPDVRAEITPGTPKYAALSKLAENFAGKKYDLNNPADRKQMRMRLLRMFQPRAKPILQDLAKAYFEKFGRPLRVTSLTRSMDYQMLLNQGNANSFKVRGEGSLPPHTSGCAFDLSRKFMTAEEQNFVMQELAQMERDGKLDALIEYGLNACFHVFIYRDGNAPRI